MDIKAGKEGAITAPSSLKHFLDLTEESLTAELNDIMIEISTGEFNVDEIHDRVTEINAQMRLIKKLRAHMKEIRRYQR